MKVKMHSFPKWLQVIQLYRKQIRFGKEEKKNFDLKSFLSLPQESAGCGFVEEGTLYLSEHLKDKIPSTGVDLLWIVDDLLTEKPSEFHFLPATAANPTEIFKIRGNDPPELHLEWNYFQVGDPSRQNMKLCELAIGKAYEIRINGKTDFSLTGRRPRHYLEQLFVVEHLGIFSECTLISDSEKLPQKKLPEARKVIDLRKLLW